MLFLADPVPSWSLEVDLQKNKKTTEESSSFHNNTLLAARLLRLFISWPATMWGPAIVMVRVLRLSVRPVLEYASPVWHESLTADQTKTLETVQRRACQDYYRWRYIYRTALLRLENLADRRDWQSRKLFKQITNRSGHCLHHLLPAKHHETVTSRLRRSVKLPPKILLFALDFLIISNHICNFVGL